MKVPGAEFIASIGGQMPWAFLSRTLEYLPG